VSVHRARFWGNYLREYGWNPIILTVDEAYYEENLDYNLSKLLPSDLRVEKVKALKITKPRLIGDVGLRGLIQMYKRAYEIIKNEKIDFILITIPSFYLALLGRRLHDATGINYGIDYQDPWIYKLPVSNKIFSRHWIASKFSRILEPYAVKKARLITGVATSYFQGVVKRNPYLNQTALFKALPFGTDLDDHTKIKDIDIKGYCFKENSKAIKLVYAGTLLPKAYEPLEMVFKSLQEHKNELEEVEIYFIGSGRHPNDLEGFNVKPMAEKYGLWQNVIFETPQRIPYLDVLKHLDIADGIFILGSTEPHYTPSKVFQGIASKKPIFAILHEESTAVNIIEQTRSGTCLTFKGEKHTNDIYLNFFNAFLKFTKSISQFNPDTVSYTEFEKYSAKNLTGQLAEKLDRIIPDIRV